MNIIERLGAEPPEVTARREELENETPKRPASEIAGILADLLRDLYAADSTQFTDWGAWDSFLTIIESDPNSCIATCYATHPPGQLLQDCIAGCNEVEQAKLMD